MVDMYKKSMCAYCKNEKCSHIVLVSGNRDVTTYKCSEYIKNESKIVPYEEPLIVTAKRDYVTKTEI